MLIEGTIIVANTAVTDASFTDCIEEISNTQVDNTKDTDAVMPMYNLI